MRSKLNQTSTLPAPPSRSGHFLLGVLPEFRRYGPLRVFTRAAREQGDVVRLRFGPSSFYLVSHPDLIKYVLQTNNRNYLRDSPSNRIVMMISGLNIFSSDGDYWLAQRRLMQPAFHRKHLTYFSQIMSDATLKMLSKWEVAALNGQILDMHDQMMRLTMEIVGRSLFSVDLSEETNVLGQFFNESIDYLNYRLINTFAPPLFIPTRRNRSLKKSIKVMNQMMQEMINERRSLTPALSPRERERREEKYDLMALLMAARYEETGEGMTDEQLRNELSTMIGAGHETTANTLTWTSYLLAEHPLICERVLAELDAVVGNRLPTIGDLGQLTYLNRVIQESLRLYPPVWSLMARQAVAEDELGGYRIPPKALVSMLPYIVHRDPRWWDDPDAFDPDRFTPERSAGRHKFAYIPFGNGPRKCIGQTFALTEALLILATILQRYKLRVKPNHKVRPYPIFSLRVRDGLPMMVTHR
jgi:cytochrome P450